MHNNTADQCLCFCYTASTIPLTSWIQKYKPLASFCRCIAWFVSDLVRNPEDRFSHGVAYIMCGRATIDTLTASLLVALFDVNLILPISGFVYIVLKK